MDGRFIMLSGSAGPSCPADKLVIASRYVRSFIGEVLRRGGGIVVLAGDEESTKDADGAPHVFDWLALREVESYTENTTDYPRTCARIVMSDEAPESKIAPANLRLLRNLQQRNVVDIYPIPRDVFTGGEYRELMVERADAMLAIGGGKGTYSAGTAMIASGKPVLPLDLKLGSTAEDGDGAIALYREMGLTPSRFFPNTHQGVRNRLGLLSLDRGINEAGTVAQVSAEMLAKELDPIPLTDRATNVKRRLSAVWQTMRALPIIASAIKIFEWARGLLPFF